MNQPMLNLGRMALLALLARRALSSHRVHLAHLKHVPSPTRWRAAFAGGVLVLLAACGGGGGGDAPATAPTNPPPTSPPVQPPVSPPMAAPTSVQVTLQSDPGDPLGGGRSYSYTQANAHIQVSWSQGALNIEATGDEDWQGDFQPPPGERLKVGRYDNALRYPDNTAGRAAMRWYGVGRGCGTATGWFAVDQVVYTPDGFLDSVVLRFERFCDGAPAALRGEVRWTRSDPTVPPPVADPAAAPWQPPSGAVPATGNYLYVESEPGDPVGQGRRRLFVPREASMGGSGYRDHFNFRVDGAENWYGILAGPTGQALKRGHYTALTRYPFINPTRGGMGWVGEGRGCADPTGWVAIDRLEFRAPPTSEEITVIELRFEQRCQPQAPALRGALRWSAAEAAAPVAAEPAGLPGVWRPAPGTVPASGTYVYLSGEKGEPISNGRDFLFTPTNAVVTAREYDAVGADAPLAGALDLRIGGVGANGWVLHARTSAVPTPWRMGSYRNLPSMVPGDLSQPRFALSGRGFGCDSLSWLEVDRVVYAGDQLRELDLRFEQRCQSAYGTVPPFALRGEVHWRADDLRLPPGPAPAAPPEFWRPPAGTSPTDRNYLQIDSTRSDFIGEGAKLYTQALAAMEVSAVGNELRLKVTGDETWDATFKAMDGQPTLTPGYYGGVQGHPFHDTARGGMYWGGQGRGCNTLRGGFVVDDIQYLAPGELQSVKLRFEQHCQHSPTGASWGELRWQRGDPTQPPGPGVAPAGLWRPPVDAVPASGNYLYFVSDAGEFIGEGQTRLLTETNAGLGLTHGPVPTSKVPQLTATATLNALASWTLELRPMSSLPRLAPGYYGDIRGYRHQNPAKGGLVFGSNTRGCNTQEGWFMVDSVGYQGDQLQSIALRFAQNCENTGWLHGAVRWQAR